MENNIAKDVKFEKSTMFGVRREEVDAYVEKVSKRIDELTDENAQLKSKLEILGKKIAEYQQEEESIGEVIVKAQKLSKTILIDAKVKAERIEQESISAANEVTAKAKDKAQQIVNQIKGKAMSELEILKSKISHEKQVLEISKSYTSQFKSDLLGMYAQQMEMINELYQDDSGVDIQIVDNTTPTSAVEERTQSQQNISQRNILLNEELDKINTLENTADIEAFAEDISGIDSPLNSVDDGEKTREFKKVDAQSEKPLGSINADDLMFGKNTNK